MRYISAALLAASVVLSSSAYCEEQPASKDGKSVPMQQAPEKLDAGKNKPNSSKDAKPDETRSKEQTQ